ncbi:hypothetical protein V8G54_031145 [Vigna mungo]|uniref:Uncharacterized protein n=1 Tax=Vigna mungo TaxID=3915 RepID=A0AAQ3MWC3_VIGMU
MLEMSTSALPMPHLPSMNSNHSVSQNTPPNHDTTLSLVGSTAQLCPSLSYPPRTHQEERKAEAQTPSQVVSGPTKTRLESPIIHVQFPSLVLAADTRYSQRRRTPQMPLPLSSTTPCSHHSSKDHHGYHLCLLLLGT